MLSQRTVETGVGLFVLAAVIALLVLAFKVSGLTSFFKVEGYDVRAEFEDIGQLKVRSTVKISGVSVGEVSAIHLDPATFKAVVTLHIHSKVSDIPDDSSAAILTAGLLGDNYVAITPMYSTTFLKNGSTLQDTHSAMILEKLIGQFLFKLGDSGAKNSASQMNGSSGEKK
ncbi:MAG: ABC-type transport system involved in resistance to organic solvents periplasmic component [uncultured bacterium]|nr:MAG: ABC-type transport system involved in resistance to organic solvents periplasmic component [uncultured bacterium]